MPEFPSTHLLLKVNSVLHVHGLGCFQNHIVEQGCFLDLRAMVNLDFLWISVLFFLPAVNLSVVALEVQLVELNVEREKGLVNTERTSGC